MDANGRKWGIGAAENGKVARKQYGKGSETTKFAKNTKNGPENA